MRSLNLFTNAVVDMVDVLCDTGVANVAELHSYEDANAYVEPLFAHVQDMLWDDDDPDTARDAAIAVANAAQILADLVTAETRERATR